MTDKLTPYGFTICVTDAELFAILESPEQVTLIAVEPAGKDQVVNFVLPLTGWTVASTVCPAESVTGPMAKTVGDVIVAMKVTAQP
jgi:hypothetical protein